jgi:type II secretory pathway pseudopilin PulG
MVVAGISLLLAIALPATTRLRENARASQCRANLAKISSAVLMYAEDNQKTLPALAGNSINGVWWWYKEQVKRFAGLQGKSSPNDTLFACPSDRGYDEPMPFYKSQKADYGSYCFNGVNLPGVPNIAGRQVPSIIDPSRTLLVMEWSAHAPLSWHRSKTGSANFPFYDKAESLTSFVDGHVDMIKFYYDGLNAAYTRDPIAGYRYKYSGD